MTTLLDPPAAQPAPWSVMPGWGVVVDLTPPELIDLRRLRGLRRAIAIGLEMERAVPTGVQTHYLS